MAAEQMRLARAPQCPTLHVLHVAMKDFNFKLEKLGEQAAPARRIRLAVNNLARGRVVITAFSLI